MSKSLESCECGADFIRIAKSSANLVEVRWAGDHCIVVGPGGRETLVNSHWEYPRWLRRKIARSLVAIGLAMLVIAIGLSLIA